MSSDKPETVNRLKRVPKAPIKNNTEYNYTSLPKYRVAVHKVVPIGKSETRDSGILGGIAVMAITNEMMILSE